MVSIYILKAGAQKTEQLHPAWDHKAGSWDASYTTRLVVLPFASTDGHAAQISFISNSPNGMKSKWCNTQLSRCLSWMKGGKSERMLAVAAWWTHCSLNVLRDSYHRKVLDLSKSLRTMSTSLWIKLALEGILRQAGPKVTTLKKVLLLLQTRPLSLVVLQPPSLWSWKGLEGEGAVASPGGHPCALGATTTADHTFAQLLRLY